MHLLRFSWPRLSPKAACSALITTMTMALCRLPWGPPLMSLPPPNISERKWSARGTKWYKQGVYSPYGAFSQWATGDGRKTADKDALCAFVQWIISRHRFSEQTLQKVTNWGTNVLRQSPVHLQIWWRSSQLGICWNTHCQSVGGCEGNFQEKVGHFSWRQFSREEGSCEPLAANTHSIWGNGALTNQISSTIGDKNKCITWKLIEIWVIKGQLGSWKVYNSEKGVWTGYIYLVVVSI